MKRILSLMIILVLLSCAFSVPAEESLTGAMTRVTLKAVEALDIPESYSEFSGDLYDGRWNLSWSGDDGFATALLDGDGNVLNYYRYDNRDYYERGSFDASFPKYGPEELKKTADEFMARVITQPGWSWETEEIQPSLVRSAYDTARISGKLLWGGITTDAGFILSIDAATGRVNSFYRTDAYTSYTDSEDGGNSYYGSEGEQSYHLDASCGGKESREQKPQREWARLGMRPCSVCIANESAKAAALQTLLDAFQMEAVYYVTDEKEMARLVYLHTGHTPVAVRVSDGKLVDWSADALVMTANSMAMDEDASAEASMKAYGRGLTETELSGIQVYEGAISTQELDARLRAMEELGLRDADELEQANYSVSDSKPYAHLSYRRKLTEGGEVTRSFTVDALTGRITDLYSYSSEYGRTDTKADTDAWQDKADAFLSAYYAEYLPMLRLTDSQTDAPLSGLKPTASYTYTRQHEGYLFRANSISVRIDPEDGSVCGFGMNWNEGQEFFSVDPEALIGKEKAAALWNALSGEPEPTLVYLSVPIKEEDGKAAYVLSLCWRFDRDDGVYAVDAVSGERYGREAQTESRFTYPEGVQMLYEDEVRLLGEYGVGLSDCRFTAEDLCAPETLMHLLLQAGGNETGDKMDSETLYRNLFNRFGTKPEASGSCLSRGELARVTVEAAGYGPAAKLTGIFASSALDWDQIPESLKGSLAIAEALGLIEKNEIGFDWQSPALAADAAHAVFALLSR